MDAEQIGRAVAAALLAYLIGALPFSLWIARWRGVDIQRVGSGNPGATNVARALGAKWGALALVLDMGKGLAAGALCVWLQAPVYLAAAAVLGHNWSVFLRLKGGKGVATTLGVLIAASWVAALWSMAVWLAFVALTRKVSVGSLIALLIAPLVLWLIAEEWPLVAVFAGLSALSVVRHRENIQRLMSGRESTVSSKSDAEHK